MSWPTSFLCLPKPFPFSSAFLLIMLQLQSAVAVISLLFVFKPFTSVQRFYCSVFCSYLFTLAIKIRLYLHRVMFTTLRCRAVLFAVDRSSIEKRLFHVCSESNKQTDDAVLVWTSPSSWTYSSIYLFIYCVSFRLAAYKVVMCVLSLLSLWHCIIVHVSLYCKLSVCRSHVF